MKSRSSIGADVGTASAELSYGPSNDCAYSRERLLAFPVETTLSFAYSCSYCSTRLCFHVSLLRSTGEIGSVSLS